MLVVVLVVYLVLWIGDRSVDFSNTVAPSRLATSELE